jgi:hypothetical protein
MRKTTIVIGLLMCATAPCLAAQTSAATVQELGKDLFVDGKAWLRTMITPYDATSPATREATYKVYTHIMDFDGKEPITKGPGGKYTHHRGMFIGWNDTQVGDRHVDSWHMKQCYQAHEGWLDEKGAEHMAQQSEQIKWCDLLGAPFIQEVRTIRAQAGEDGLRIFDFESILTSVAGEIQLHGDLQHAGMHVRLADEVSTHEESTEYILPEGATELGDDRVEGAWWVCCSAVVADKRYWIIHMTPPTNPGGVPVYSVRRYARFGAFFEPTLEEGKPLDLSFRIVVSDHTLGRRACQILYNEYAKSFSK